MDAVSTDEVFPYVMDVYNAFVDMSALMRLQ